MLSLGPAGCGRPPTLSGALQGVGMMGYLSWGGVEQESWGEAQFSLHCSALVAHRHAASTATADVLVVA